MDRIVLLVGLLIFSISMLSAQRSDSKWSLLLGGQAVYGFASAPEARVETANDFLSGYAQSSGFGLVSSVQHQASSMVSFSISLGVDVRRFSYDLLSPPTFGEVQGQTLPGRFLTEYKGVGATAFAELGTEIALGSSNWSPALVIKGGHREWVKEHSNADSAFDAGYQIREARDDARYQAYVAIGFGVSPLKIENRLSLLFQQTLEAFEPIHQSLVLRSEFNLNQSGKGIACPTF